MDWNVCKWTIIIWTIKYHNMVEFKWTIMNIMIVNPIWTIKYYNSIVMDYNVCKALGSTVPNFTHKWVV